MGSVVAGRMHIVLLDGRAAEVDPGDVFVCRPGHDAWTVGDEACMLLDTGGATYAVRS